MSTPNNPGEAGKAPRSAESRDMAARLSTGPYGDLSGCARLLLAGADAMDSLAAMRAQRDRLAEALRQAIAFLDACRADPERAKETGAMRDAQDWMESAARAALAELEGGAS